MKISVKKISKLSGFSQATVSNALTGKRRVGRETAEKILRIAREHGYTMEKHVRRIRVVTYRDSGEVFSDSPFFSALLEGIENECRAQGYETAIINLYCRHEDYKEQVEALLADRESGIILIGTELKEETARVFQEAQMPLVVVDCWLPRVPMNAVLMENEDSVMEAVEYLIRQGHRAIGYIKSNVRIQNFEHRARGFFRALAAHDIAPEERFLIEVPPSTQGAHRVFAELLEAGREMPTAFFADNDMMALGAMQTLQAHGFRIPQDISIVGFDDIVFSQSFSPGLTTIRVHKKELGQAAVRRLIELVHDPGQPVQRIQLINELVLRGSVAMPPEED